MEITDKKWLKLNGHGKNCLRNYLFAFSNNDVYTTKLDYLWSKGLVGSTHGVFDLKKRCQRTHNCLTDLGVETAKHYFPDWF